MLRTRIRFASWIAAAFAFGAILTAVPSSGLAAEPTASEESTAQKGLLGKAASFRGKNLRGETVTLESLLKKGPVLVDFWATWCKPCLKELPHLQRIHDKFKDSGLQVLAVTIDSPKTESRVKPFVLGKKYSFDVVLDSSQDVFRALQGKGTIPYVVLIDKDGNLRYRHTGYRPGDELAIEKVVAEVLGVPASVEENVPAKNDASSTTESSEG